MKSFMTAASGALVLAAAAAGAAVLAPSPFDYAHAGEASRQHYLDGLAAGFRSGFHASVGRRAQVESLTADARAGLISVDIRLRDARAERLSENEVDAIGDSLGERNCALLGERGLLDDGVAMRIFVKRPSGGALAGFSFDKESCAVYSRS